MTIHKQGNEFILQCSEKEISCIACGLAGNSEFMRRGLDGLRSVPVRKITWQLIDMSEKLASSLIQSLVTEEKKHEPVENI